MLSNKSVAIICAILFVGIMLDGRAYNRPPDRIGIYTLPAHPDIRIKKDNELIMSFAYEHGRWLLTEPFVAPVKQSRVEALLETNHATNRKYTAAELDGPQLFADAISLEIDDFSFAIGQREQVSQLRYVKANDDIYLQADNVIPMLQAGQSAFVDLAVTGKVKSVQVNQQPLADVDAWSNLQSLGLIAAEKINSPAVAELRLTSPDHHQQTFALHSVEGIAVMIFEGDAYGYLLSTDQAQSLGLIDFL